ncbi:MAG: type II toxin-antitoxin system RelE/ParE family toxin [Sulfuricella denitrificans]|nr:type II toxin-antitoxin system RelE/ParE family toxin [Sulfuricella denitrificans]
MDKATGVVAKDPTVGERKESDPSDLLGYKFRSQNQIYLLGYSVEEEVCLVYLEPVGPLFSHSVSTNAGHEPFSLG